MPLTNNMLLSQRADPTVRPVRSIVRERSYSNEEITVENALTVSGVIAIITIISQDLAGLPLILYGRRGRNKFRATDHPYYRLLHDAPNPEHSAMTFREFIVSHLIAWGNFYAQMIIDKTGTVQELYPLRPDRMTVERVDGEKVFKYRTSEGKQRVFLADEILHIPALGFNGLTGLSRIALASHAIGLTKSTEKFGSKFFANGANPGIIYKHPAQLSDNAYKHLNESLERKSGVDESHKPIILEEGMGIEKLGIPPDDAQFLDTRKFQLSEINRMIGPVPPHMIGDIEKSTSWGTGIDSQEQGYVNHTLRPYAIRVEQALRQQLLLSSDREQGYYFEHLFDGFLRGDIATRYEAYVKGITNGFISRNEVRARENLNPRKGLDVLLQPLNMTTIGDSGASVDFNTSNPDTVDTVSSALDPLWRDAMRRVLKREVNDVAGAAKRWQAKGQTEAFAGWVEAFYRKDHLAFIQKQFKPILDAQVRLLGVDISERLDLYMLDFLTKRIEQAKQFQDLPVDQECEHFMSFIHVCIAEAQMDDEMESSDE